MAALLPRRTLLARLALAGAAPAAAALLATCGGTSQVTTSTSVASTSAVGTAPVSPSIAATTRPSASPARPASQGQTVVEFTMPGAQGAEQQIRDQWVAAFNAKHPDIKVNADFVVANLDEKIQTRIAGGDPPDVLQTDANRFGQFVRKGIYRPLDDLITRDKVNKDDYFQVFLPAFVYQGKTYGIPKDNGSTALAYNVGHFDEARAPYPNDAMTWDDMLDRAQKLTKRPGGSASARPTQYGVLISTAFSNYYPFVLQNGGDLLSKDGTSFVMNSPEATEALQWMADLATKHGVAPTPDVTSEIGTEGAFLAGKVSMYYVWTSSIGNLRAIKSFDWDIVQLPTRKRRGNQINGAAFPIYAGTKKLDAAWEMCKWTFGMDGERIFVIGPLAKDVPSLKALEPELLKEPPPPKNQKAKFDALDYGTPFQGPARWAEISTALTKELDDLWRGKATATAVTATLKSEIDPLLRD